MAGKVKREVDSAELSSFCSQVALILSAGLPLYDGMETLAETTKGSEFADLYENASKGGSETGSLYQALHVGASTAPCPNRAIFADYRRHIVAC